MADNSAKRHRADSVVSSEFDESSPSSKRHKPYDNILNLLDEEEKEEPAPRHEPSHELSHDLSAIYTTLQQELSSSATTTSTAAFSFESVPSTEELELAPEAASVQCVGEDDDESVKSVMRHLLEASDDELGIPNTRDENGVEDFSAVENLQFAYTDDGLWELEDVAANYYAVLQAQLLM